MGDTHCETIPCLENLSKFDLSDKGLFCPYRYLALLGQRGVETAGK